MFLLAIDLIGTFASGLTYRDYPGLEYLGDFPLFYVMVGELLVHDGLFRHGYLPLPYLADFDCVARHIKRMLKVRRAMLGSGGFSDGYEIGSKRQRMMESNPYFGVSSSASGYQQAFDYDSRSRPSAFPVVRLRGLPFDCAEIDIYKFFAGLDIVDIFVVNKDGRFSGEAFVVFAGHIQVDYALQRDRQNMGRRYVEVFSCKKQDYYQAIAAEMKEGGYESDYRASPPHRPKRAQNKEQMEYTEILKMRGLPYRCKRSDILKFFGKEFNLTDDKINITYRADGKATGDAYVEFASAEEAKKAMCKDNMMIGSRYIELFPSDPDEARRAGSRSRQ